MRKLRADSKLNALTEDELAELVAMLAGGELTLAGGVEWLEAHGVTMSAQALSQYYRTHVLPVKFARMQTIAQALASVPDEGVADATHRAVAQRVFELATDPQADLKNLLDLYKAQLKSEENAQTARRLAMLEAKAAAADAAKAALEARVASGGLTPEALALAEQQLALL